MNVKADYRYM